MFDRWFPVFARYTSSVGAPIGEAEARTVWRWVLDGSYRIAGLLEVDEAKEVAGFALYRPLPDIELGREVCALDAVYVDAPFRGRGLERDLIAGVCAIAVARSWGEVRWTVRPSSAVGFADQSELQPTDLTTFRVPLAVR
jgi:GNAT superfamily N-acetyltransferase